MWVTRVVCVVVCVKQLTVCVFISSEKHTGTKGHTSLALPYYEGTTYYHYSSIQRSSRSREATKFFFSCVLFYDSYILRFITTTQNVVFVPTRSREKTSHAQELSFFSTHVVVTAAPFSLVDCYKLSVTACMLFVVVFFHVPNYCILHVIIKIVLALHVVAISWCWVLPPPAPRRRWSHRPRCVSSFTVLILSATILIIIA